MNITGICPYETPCGYCTKWDKKCDKKIGSKPRIPAPPCWECVNSRIYGMPNCEKCNRENNYKYFIRTENNND